MHMLRENDTSSARGALGMQHKQLAASERTAEQHLEHQSDGRNDDPDRLVTDAAPTRTEQGGGGGGRNVSSAHMIS
jgi:hypothetical protein